MRNKHYNKKYFIKRDHLDLHIADTIKGFLKQNNITKVLDVGCGTGRLVKYLNDEGIDTYGCDANEGAVTMARRINKKGAIKMGLATSPPFKKNGFNLVCAISLIEHLSRIDTKKFLDNSSKLLKNDGHIFIVTPNFNSPLRYLFGKDWFGYKDPTHLQYFTPKSLRRSLTRSGFDNISFQIKTGGNVSFDWPLPKYFRFLPRQVKKLLNYAMISSPLSTFRDSLWVIAHKK